MSEFEHPASSYYVASAHPFPAQPSLRGRHEFDVCVIGGGYTGLSAALELAERGYRVALLEQARIGWGASGRNGGQINLGLRKGAVELVAKFGRDPARALFALAEEARLLIDARIAKHAIACDRKPGTIFLASKPGDLSWMAEEVEALERDFAYTGARLLDRQATRAEIGSKIFHGAIADAGGGHLHPLNYALGLAKAAIAAGVAIFEQTKALRLETGATCRIVAAEGEIVARHVVLGCNAYLGDLDPGIAGKIMPIANFIVATEPLPENVARDLIARDVCACDSKFVVSYWRLSADRRLLFGGGERYTTRPPASIADFVRPYMLKVYPQMRDRRLEYGWGGMLAITASRLPHIGRRGNLFFAQGYSGQGVAIAGLAGKLIAEALAGTAERFDLFAAIPHRTFPGGTALRHPLLVLAMLWYALRDRL